ncbi:MAG TPA: ATP-binding protein [Candidatus Dormibacteraeota bacterium]|nr:ATP-binding protein [Candidatus Dormibacteraeota bacterium]
MKRFPQLRLRSKFAMSLVLIIAALTCVTLLMVRAKVQENARQQVTTQANNSLVIFEILRHQHMATLNRRASLLATQAFLSDNDTTEFKDSTENPFTASAGDLVVLANQAGHVLAIRSGNSSFSSYAAEALLKSSLSREVSSDWWVDRGRLYQVELQPIGADALSKAKFGTIIVGQQIDERSVQDLGRLLSGHVAFRHAGQIVAGTLYPFQEQELLAQSKNSSPPSQVRIGDERFFATSVNLTSGPSAVTLMVLKSDADTMAFLDKLNEMLVGIAVVAIIVGGCLVYAVSHTFTEPLNRLVEGVHALEHGDYYYEVNTKGDDEVSEVALAFDRMRRTLLANEVDKHSLEEQLRQSQKMDALGRLAGGVAHDFNNLLTIIKGHSGLLMDYLDPNETSFKNCEQIAKAADRAASLTRQLLIFSRGQALQPKVLDLNPLIADVDKLLRRLIREDIAYHFQSGPALGRIKADAGQIEQVLLNLVVNACDAMPRGGKLKIQTSNITAHKGYLKARPGLRLGEYVLLSASDTGHGMDESTKARIFEPFFTTKENGKGTGLGLATVYGVVKESGGFIWVDSTPGKGTRFEIYFPRVYESADSLSEDLMAFRPTRVDATVMVVEDEAGVRDLASSFLQSAGYQVLTAEDGAAALDIAYRLGGSIDVVLTDIVMPKIRGTDLAKRLRTFLPNVKIIYMSGYLDVKDTDIGLLVGSHVLQKPFTKESVVQKVSEALNQAVASTAEGRDSLPAPTGTIFYRGGSPKSGKRPRQH